jgi:hypothetical protein
MPGRRRGRRPRRAAGSRRGTIRSSSRGVAPTLLLSAEDVATPDNDTSSTLNMLSLIHRSLNELTSVLARYMPPSVEPVTPVTNDTLPSHRGNSRHGVPLSSGAELISSTRPSSSDLPTTEMVPHAIQSDITARHPANSCYTGFALSNTTEICPERPSTNLPTATRVNYNVDKRGRPRILHQGKEICNNFNNITGCTKAVCSLSHVCLSCYSNNHPCMNCQALFLQCT